MYLANGSGGAIYSRGVGYLSITLRRSVMGRPPVQRATVAALGFGVKGRLNSRVLQPNTSAVRGMVNRVKHMVEVRPVVVATAAPLPRPRPRNRRAGTSRTASPKTVQIETLERVYPELAGKPTRLD